MSDEPFAMTVSVPWDYLDGSAFVFVDGGWLRLVWVEPNEPDDRDPGAVARAFESATSPGGSAAVGSRSA